MKNYNFIEKSRRTGQSFRKRFMPDNIDINKIEDFSVENCIFCKDKEEKYCLFTRPAEAKNIKPTQEAFVYCQKCYTANHPTQLFGITSKEMQEMISKTKMGKILEKEKEEKLSRLKDKKYFSTKLQNFIKTIHEHKGIGPILIWDFDLEMIPLDITYTTHSWGKFHPGRFEYKPDYEIEGKADVRFCFDEEELRTFLFRDYFLPKLCGLGRDLNIVDVMKKHGLEIN